MTRMGFQDGHLKCHSAKVIQHFILIIFKGIRQTITRHLWSHMRLNVREHMASNLLK